ncbi:MAG TPA: efflux RND transporter periplasmic adaptor subunit [Xanthobacteraceae bacterium]|nr:efflux RND transporter periplasmic adaptor subunit [Xanthobacteraceae bacterium]
MKPLDPKSLQGAKEPHGAAPARGVSRKARAAGLVILLAIGALGWWFFSGTTKPVSQPRRVAITVTQAQVKDVPYTVEAPGAVQPVVSVPIRSRVDSMVEKVLFKDGAAVKEGDLLFKLDSRAIDASVEQAEATLKRDQASLAKAQRDVERFSGLVAKGTTPKVTLEDAQTNADMLKATVKQDQANLDNLKAQRSYYDIYAPVTGRIGISSVRPGNVVRTDTASTPLATVNQMTPIYVTFGLPERYVPDLRAAGTNATVEASLQNGTVVQGGHVAFIENSVDAQTGTILVRALFDNQDEKLWPGTLASVRVTLRTDKNAVTVPNEAVQNGQRGSFVFVVENGAAKVHSVTVARTAGGESIIAKGLSGNETVVTDGQLSLRDGTLVDIKRKAES